MLRFNKLDAMRVYLTYEGLVSLGFTLAYTVNMVYLVRVVGLDAFQMVLVGTVLETTAFLFEVPTGVVADVYSRRLSVILGLLLLGIHMLIFVAVPSFMVVLFSQVVAGIGYTFISGATTAWMVDEIGEEHTGQAMLKASQVGRIAGIAGIIISISLALVNLTLPIVLGGTLLLANAIFLLLFMPESGFTPTPREDRQTFNEMFTTLRNGGRAIRTSPVLITLLAVEFVFGAFSEGFDRLWTLHILESFTLPQIGDFDLVIWFGIIDLVGMGIGIVFTEYVRKRVDTNRYQQIVRSLITIHALMIVFLVVFALAQSFWLALAAFWILGPLRGLIYPLQNAWMNQGLDSKVRATVLSMHAQTNAIGQMVGGPGIGYIGRAFGVRTALALGGVILSPVLPLFARTLRQGKIAQTVEAEAVA